MHPHSSYNLYAPHSIAINPFKSVLVKAFVKERQIGVQDWPILPDNVGEIALPLKFGAANLLLEEEEREKEKKVYDNDERNSNDIDDPTPTKVASTEPTTPHHNTNNEEEANKNLTRAMQLILDAIG
ncbi:hypothetical protein V5O48_005002 [Marasmius crinis-equi]|uniref:Uncharacterized protein n=1 Tax=Marasmius crinis-equi TaxID=585013 RepID=A0ABR3FPI3_9AGAR